MHCLLTPNCWPIVAKLIPLARREAILIRLTGSVTVFRGMRCLPSQSWTGCTTSRTPSARNSRSWVAHDAVSNRPCSYEEICATLKPVRFASETSRNPAAIRYACKCSPKVASGLFAKQARQNIFLSSRGIAPAGFKLRSHTRQRIRRLDLSMRRMVTESLAGGNAGARRKTGQPPNPRPADPRGESHHPCASRMQGACRAILSLEREVIRCIVWCDDRKHQP